MLYLDTSFVTPLFKPEAKSPDVERFTSALPPGRPAVSHWTRVEFASLLAKNVRMGLTMPIQANAAERAFDLFVKKAARSSTSRAPISTWPATFSPTGAAVFEQGMRSTSPSRRTTPRRACTASAGS